MKLYLAGPMTGHPHYNAMAFIKAKVRLEDEGHEVITPFDANSRIWRQKYGEDFDPYKHHCDWGDPLLRDMFVEDVKVLLLEVDGLALLPGWEESTGSKIEYALAQAFEMPVIQLREV